MIALILTGGLSRRMGRDKLLIERPDGLRQIDWLVKLARDADMYPVLSGRGNLPPLLDLPILEDRISATGPLAALDAFHHAYPAHPVLLLGGDLFLIDRTTIGDLLAGRAGDALATCYANRLDGQAEPLCAIYEAAALHGLAEQLARGERRARRFLADLSPRILPLRNPVALDNVNSPGELEEAFAKLRHGVSAKQLQLRTPSLSGPFVSLACTVGGLLSELAFIHRWKVATEEIAVRQNEMPAALGDPLENGALVSLATDPADPCHHRP